MVSQPRIAITLLRRDKYGRASGHGSALSNGLLGSVTRHDLCHKPAGFRQQTKSICTEINRCDEMKKKGTEHARPSNFWLR